MEHDTNKQSDLLNNNTEYNKAMKSLTYKIIANRRADFVLQYIYIHKQPMKDYQ